MEKPEIVPVKDDPYHDIETSAFKPEPEVGEVGDVGQAADGLSRQLNNRHIQLIAIGGSIGTALFVTIGNGLGAGGPASMLITWTCYCFVMACVNNCIAEMTILQPVSGGFVRLAGKYVDDALAFMVGWNFFFYEALNIPFEISAICLSLEFWRDDIPAAAVCVACIILYAYGPLVLFPFFFFFFFCWLVANSQTDCSTSSR